MPDRTPRLPGVQTLADIQEWIHRHSPYAQKGLPDLPAAPQAELPAPIRKMIEQGKQWVGSYFTPAPALRATGDALKGMTAQQAEGPLNLPGRANKAIADFAIDTAVDSTTPGGALLNLPGGGPAAKGVGEAITLAKFPGGYRSKEGMAQLVDRLMLKSSGAPMMKNTPLEGAMRDAIGTAPGTFNHLSDVTLDRKYNLDGNTFHVAAINQHDVTPEGYVGSLNVNPPFRYADPVDLRGILLHEGTHVGQILQEMDRFKRSAMGTAKDPWQPSKVQGRLYPEIFDSPESWTGRAYQRGTDQFGYRDNPYEEAARATQWQRTLPELLVQEGRDVPSSRGELREMAVDYANDPDLAKDNFEVMLENLRRNIFRQLPRKRAREEWDKVTGDDIQNLDFTAFEVRER